ncbi:hypothetical protein N7534_009017, partial [Penicillium rubens]
EDLTTPFTSKDLLRFFDSIIADFYNIRATIIFKSVKGYKDIFNENFVRFIRPLDDIEYLYIYPIT